MNLVIVQPPEGALNRSGQFISSTIDSLMQGLGMVRGGDGLAAFEAGFDNAAFVILAAFVPSRVAQVNLHSRDVIAESAQGALHCTTDMIDQSLLTLDIVVGINLNLHDAFLT
jgi:hypothetical protein